MRPAAWLVWVGGGKAGASGISLRLAGGEGKGTLGSGMGGLGGLLSTQCYKKLPDLKELLEGESDSSGERGKGRGTRGKQRQVSKSRLLEGL